MNMKGYTVYKVWIWKGILSIKYEYESLSMKYNMKGYTVSKVWIGKGIYLKSMNIKVYIVYEV